MIKFGKSLLEYERCLIEFERKRTILYISKLNNKKIWINIWRDDKNEIISGIVEAIINGTIKNDKHLLLGGEFRLNNDKYYIIKDVFAISFRPFSLEDEDFKKDWANMFNSSIYGDEAESKSNILFSWTDLQPQDFNAKTSSEIGQEFTDEFRCFNTRYYNILAKSLRG